MQIPFINVSFMYKEDFIGFILNDIKELELIVKSMREMENIPEVMRELAISKTQNMLDKFSCLEGKQSLPKEDVAELEIPPCVRNDDSITCSSDDFESSDECEHDFERATDGVTQSHPVSNQQPEEKKIVTNEKFTSPVSTVNTVKRVESRFVQNLRKAININDRYRYRKELFDGDTGLMNSVIDKLDAMKSLEEAMAYVRREFVWDEKSITVTDFYLLLENRFS